MTEPFMSNEEYFKTKDQNNKRKNIGYGIIVSIAVIGVIYLMIFVVTPFVNRMQDSMDLPYKLDLSSAEQQQIDDMKMFNVYGQGYQDSEYDGHDCWVHQKVTNPDGSSYSGSMCVDGYAKMVQNHQETLKEIARIQKELAN